ncbi:phosphate signaling complex protein PhoU [Aquibaculum sediminis]|uniref:phosphate signaling complex protein PhoU n=1 Tax=Aquibaculum sediminis TaxID=3231907 RepID=UPI003454EE69
MAGSSEHIIRAYDEELQSLNGLIARMGGLAESQLAAAVDALVKGDTERAQRIVAGDRALDELEQEIDAAVVRMLALRQPVAGDLRSVVAALKIASDLERIGDYAKNVAKRSTALAQSRQMETLGAIARMARLVQAGIKQVLDAYLQRDARLALDVWERDREIDEMYTGLFRATLTYMMEDPRNITPATHLLFIAKNIERMGDHATNIAEVVHFMVTGNRLEGGRPKGDASSYAVVEPESPRSGGEGK